MLLNNNAILHASRAEPPGQSSQRSKVVLSFSGNVAAFSESGVLVNANPAGTLRAQIAEARR